MILKYEDCSLLGSWFCFYKDQDSPLDDSTAEDCNLLGSLGFSFIIKEEV